MQVALAEYQNHGPTFLGATQKGPQHKSRIPFNTTKDISQLSLIVQMITPILNRKELYKRLTTSEVCGTDVTISVSPALLLDLD
jgi:hypothetical protein